MREQHRPLRQGFSTGTAAAAAARAALRSLCTGELSPVIAVRLPSGCFLPIRVEQGGRDGRKAWAAVIKDGGDDPDITHGARVSATVSMVHDSSRLLASAGFDTQTAGTGDGPEAVSVCLIGGPGIGVVTRPGLPVQVGEPAVNPVPREMLVANLGQEWLTRCHGIGGSLGAHEQWTPPEKPHVFLAGSPNENPCGAVWLAVELGIERGEELARRTLNPRLGIVGGLSVLGTTGIVKPFSHQAYEQTIAAELAFALANGCTEVVLSTGGKSEKYARELLADRPAEAFVQIADFYGFAVRTARAMGFRALVHSVFFGKAIKMAQGLDYTHAHKAPLELGLVAELAGDLGLDRGLCEQLAQANTARHALEILLHRGLLSVVEAVGCRALEQSRRLTHEQLAVRVLLFDYQGALLVDLGG
jgi:cobalt-precorrin-5B (C1)-methyltransferase